MEQFNWYDEDIWNAIRKTLKQKNRINNDFFFQRFHSTFIRMNRDPKNPFFGKLDEDI